MLQEKERESLIHEIKVCPRAPLVSHLFFADDCLPFTKASVVEIAYKGALAVYKKGSGQIVNFSKSSISFSPNVIHDC